MSLLSAAWIAPAKGGAERRVSHSYQLPDSWVSCLAPTSRHWFKRTTARPRNAAGTTATGLTCVIPATVPRSTKAPDIVVIGADAKHDWARHLDTGPARVTAQRATEGATQSYPRAALTSKRCPSKCWCRGPTATVCSASAPLVRGPASCATEPKPSALLLTWRPGPLG